MSAKGSLWLPLAILLLLAALSYWIERSVQISENGNDSERKDPEGIMENFEAMRTDATGQPQYRLTARRLKHYSGGKRTELESPRIVQLDAKTGEVSAVAQQATVSSDGHEVDLRGNVRVLRAAQKGQSALSLETARLLVFPERNLLQAPGPVEISDANLNVHASAMEFDYKQRVIKLTGRVQARYTYGKS
jgi:lipopolysaccharide export system protein LptC